MQLERALRGLLDTTNSAALMLVAALGLVPEAALAQAASQEIPKQVDLVIDGSWLVASNVRFSRFDELKLNAQEQLGETSVGKGVIVAVTNQRIIGYGVRSGWRSIPRSAGEQVERVSAEDFAGLVVTNKRLLNFNGDTGVWGERQRRVN